MEGCVDGKHDKDCPLYTEEVDLIQDAECAHLEGCVDGKHDPDCPCYKEADPLMLARGVQVSDAIYLDASGDDKNNGTSAETAVQTLEKAYEIAEDGNTIYLLSDIVLHQPTVLTGDKSVTIESASDDETHTITYASATSPKPIDEDYMIKIGNEAGTPVQTQVVLANLVIDAETQDMRCLRVCSGASLTLDDGATVTNGRAISHDGTTGSNDWGGGIVVDGNATLTMEDGSEITNCSAEWGGAVYVSGEMVINGGEISKIQQLEIFKYLQLLYFADLASIYYHFTAYVNCAAPLCRTICNFRSIFHRQRCIAIYHNTTAPVIRSCCSIMRDCPSICYGCSIIQSQTGARANS